jgi:hypothetical protein
VESANGAGGGAAEGGVGDDQNELEDRHDGDNGDDSHDAGGGARTGQGGDGCPATDYTACTCSYNGTVPNNRDQPLLFDLVHDPVRVAVGDFLFLIKDRVGASLALSVGTGKPRGDGPPHVVEGVCRAMIA